MVVGWCGVVLNISNILLGIFHFVDFLKIKNTYFPVDFYAIGT